MGVSVGAGRELTAAGTRNSFAQIKHAFIELTRREECFLERIRRVKRDN
jgi:hypothetical protein